MLLGCFFFFSFFLSSFLHIVHIIQWRWVRLLWRLCKITLPSFLWVCIVFDYSHLIKMACNECNSDLNGKCIQCAWCYRAKLKLPKYWVAHHMKNELVSKKRASIYRLVVWLDIVGGAACSVRHFYWLLINCTNKALSVSKVDFWISVHQA